MISNKIKQRVKSIIRASSLLGLLHWTRIPAFQIEGNDYQFLTGYTVEECQAECEAVSDNCFAIEFNKGEDTCVLKSISPLNGQLFPFPGCDIYMYCEMRTTNGECLVL